MKHKLNQMLHIRPIRFLVDMVNIYFDKHISRSAAALAYFLILTVFPILICISAFLAQLDLNLESVLREMGTIFPSAVNAVLEQYVLYVESSQGPGFFIVGATTTVLFASAAVRGLMTIMREIYGHESFSGLTQVVASVVFAILLLVTIYLSIAVLVTGNEMLLVVGDLFHIQQIVQRLMAWQWLKFLIFLAMVLLFILLLYRFTAPLAKPRPPVLLGAFGAAVALLIGSMVFSWFIGRSSRYSLVYGSLASVIILLVWLYFCGNILILGSVFNYVWYQHGLEKQRGIDGREHA